MVSIEVTYQNGDSIKTRFNGTFEEAKAYFVGRTFNIGAVNDDLQVCTDIRLLDSENQHLFKTARRGELSVGMLCSLVNGDVRLIDNGNGCLLANDGAENIAKGGYAACLVGTVTAKDDVIGVWLPRK